VLPVDERTGQILLGRYKLERLLGKGGMGSVWLASHLRTGRRVAVKLLEDRYLSNAAIVKRFGREARAASAIEHPGIVEVLDLDCTEDGVPFIVMELLEGETLAQHLESHGPLDQQQALDVFVPLLDALEAAHERGIVHRDLKPDNIFLLPPGAGGKRPVKILDFGISQKADEVRSHLTQTGAVLGTPHYMSPEQALGESDLDARADVYAAAVVLYECVVGDVPYDAANYNALLQAILRASPKRPRELGARVSVAFEDVILLAMEKDRDKRIGTAREFRERLVAAATGSVLPASRTVADRGASGAPSPTAARVDGSASAPSESSAPAPIWGDFDFGAGAGPRPTPNLSHTTPPGSETGMSSSSMSAVGAAPLSRAAGTVGAPVSAPRPSGPWPASRPAGIQESATASPPRPVASSGTPGFPAMFLGAGAVVRTFDDEATGPALELEDVPIPPRTSRVSGTLPVPSASPATPERSRRDALADSFAAAPSPRRSSSGVLPAVDAAGPVTRRPSSSGGFPAVSGATDAGPGPSPSRAAVVPGDAGAPGGPTAPPMPDLGAVGGVDGSGAPVDASGPPSVPVGGAGSARGGRIASVPRAAWTALAAVFAFVAVVAVIRSLVRPGEPAGPAPGSGGTSEQVAKVRGGSADPGAGAFADAERGRAGSPPSPGTVDVEVVGLPHNARMRLDGLPAATLPLRVRAGQRHVLEVEAPGYESRRIEFTPEGNLRLPVDLRPAR
jgi:serine/threonine-protein kinase